MQQVELKEQEKTLVYLDSMLQEKQKEVDTIKKNYTFEKDAEYQIGIKDSQIVVERKLSVIAYLGNTLESVIQLADMFKKVGTKEQQEQINAALTDLVTIGDRWNEA